MSLTPKWTNVVVLGAWNPAIVQPAWLAERKVIETSEPLPAVNTNAFTEQFHFVASGVTWLIDEQRLSVGASSELDVGVSVARVLGLLSYTPVYSIGTNFSYETKASAWPEDKMPKLGNWSLENQGKSDGFQYFMWTGMRLIGEDTQCHMSVTRNLEDMVFVYFNLHRNVRNAAAAAMFAGQWADDLKMVTEMLNEMLSK
jgi:hypothetical protein